MRMKHIGARDLSTCIGREDTFYCEDIVDLSNLIVIICSFPICFLSKCLSFFHQFIYIQIYSLPKLTFILFKNCNCRCDRAQSVWRHDVEQQKSCEQLIAALRVFRKSQLRFSVNLQNQLHFRQLLWKPESLGRQFNLSHCTGQPIIVWPTLMIPIINEGAAAC